MRKNTQIEIARSGEVSDDLKDLAQKEGLDEQCLVEEVAAGRVVILKNKLRKISGCLVGQGTRTKVNANIGTSELLNKPDIEIKKLEIAESAGADVVMDLSTGGDVDSMRAEVLKKSNIPVGTVPIYQAMIEAHQKHGDMLKINKEILFDVIRKQCESGVDFVTVHCGLNKEVVKQLDLQERIAGIVSRGGSFIAKWIRETGNENPLYEYYDELIEIVKEYDVVLSLGDGLRPGALADATDRAQIMELVYLGELTQRALAKGVGVMVEGPGHVPIDQIETNMKIQKSLCNDAPFYVLGPIVTDIAPGYDHITSAIGGAWAAYYGADFLCYVTPSEHLGLPSIDDVKDGVMVSKIAAHAADVAKNRSYRQWDDRMSKARKALDWNGQMDQAIDREKAEQIRSVKNPGNPEACSMCGDYCSMK